MEAVPAAIALAGTGFKVAGDIEKGSAESKGDIYQAQADENSAQIGEVKANQTSQQMTSNLQKMIGNVDAVRASANDDPLSPTGQAIVNRQQALGDTRTQTAVSNIMQQVAQDQSASKYYQSAASSALLGGYLAAGGDLLTGIKGMMNPDGGSP